MRWYTVRGTGKHAQARFIKAANGPGQGLRDPFIGKVYGHEGQDAEFNAVLMAGAPLLLDIVRQTRGASHARLHRRPGTDRQTRGNEPQAEGLTGR